MSSPPPPPSFPEVTTGASYSASASCFDLVPSSTSSDSTAAAADDRQDQKTAARILTPTSIIITTSKKSSRHNYPSTRIQGTNDVSIKSQESPTPPSDKINQALPSSSAHSSTETSLPTATESSTASMVFSDFYKGPKSPLAKLRHHNTPLTSRSAAPPPSWLDDEYADLMAKDKIKQKEAVKRYLTAKVKSDWDFLLLETSTMPQQDQTGRQRTRPTPTESATSSPHTQAPTKSEDHPQQVDGGDDLHISSEDDDHDNDDKDNDDDDDEDQDSDAESIYSVVSEDNLNFRPRLEWTSELSDNDTLDRIHSSYQNGQSEPVAIAGKTSTLDKRTGRRRANREEMTWNEGLACFEARRDAWTGARTVRVRSKAISPSSTSPRSPRCFFFPRSSSGPTPASNPSGLESPRGGVEGGSITTSDTCSITKGDKDLEKQKSKTSSQSSNHLFPVQTLLPIPHPILPPNNALRASVTPSIYLGLYDKVILNNLQPACPINLSDMLRACVAGWKRDGEWPPRASAIDPIPAARKKQQQQQQSKRASMGNSESLSTTARRMSFGILGRGGDDESRAGKGIRRSLQRAFGFGSSPGGAET